jgi:hypothetical protein
VDTLQKPSVLRDSKFTKKGLARTESGLLVPAYVGSPSGFYVPGQIFLNEHFYPVLRERGILPLCPWTSCAEYDVPKLTEHASYADHEKAAKAFNSTIDHVNYDLLMPRAKFMIAILDGDREPDVGVVAESVHFSDKHGRVIGIRSDFRLGENIGAKINPALLRFYEGGLLTGNDAYEKALDAAESLADKIRGKKFRKIKSQHS